MRIRSALICAVALFLVAATWVVAALPTDPCTLPPALHDELLKKYPGTHLVALKDLSMYDRLSFQKDHGRQCPGLVRVNFYGDGKPTWAVVLIAGESPRRKAELVVAHQTGDGWDTRSLQTTDGTPVVWREDPGKYADVYGKKSIRAASPTIVFAGYGSWSTLYAWTGKEVEKVQLSD